MAKQNITLCIVCVLVAAYLAVATGFVNRQRQRIYCRAIDVVICDSDKNRFVDATGVRRMVENENPPLLGTPLDRINTQLIEAHLNAKSAVKSTQAYTTLDGVLHVRVYQRRPVVRVLAGGGSFYIDDTGYVFPFSHAYTAYVPVVTGAVGAAVTSGYTGPIPERDTLLQQLYAFARFLDRHTFWRSQVLQVHVRNAHNIELIPRVGNHLIALGPFDDYEYKLKKLYTFYREALPREGWERFSRFDLRYGNQIVATKN
ncbi:MAG: hypothetical protein LBS12_04505 [Prevotellaceae bacterium]|jgi:cell division protein FtsQ|nr:hypothetical protein [Prevotellaceae bacterium]